MVPHCCKKIFDVMVVEPVPHAATLAVCDNVIELSQDSELLRNGIRLQVHGSGQLVNRSGALQQGE